MERQIMQVGEFQKSAKAPIPSVPTLLNESRAKLRLNLLMEEVREFERATMESDIVGVADALIDQLYIILGTAHEYGLADRLIMLFDEVHRSNMSKFVNGEFLQREDGKIIKPQSYFPPNLKRIVERDFSIYKEADGRVMEQLMAESKKTIEGNINKSIMRVLSDEHKEVFQTYLDSEQQIKELVEVEVSETCGQTFAKIKYNGIEETVLVD